GVFGGVGGGGGGVGAEAVAGRGVRGGGGPREEEVAPRSSTLVMSEGRGGRDDGRAKARKAPVMEALVLGHLPVMAGAWAAAYAGDRAAATGEGVALVRLTGGRISIDVFDGEDVEGRESLETLEGALGVAAARARRWMVRVDAVNELEVASAAHVSEASLLCGADEAAVVAAYRTLKGLAETLEARPTHAATMRVAVMGADEAKAQRAAEKIARASQAFLSSPVETVVGAARIGETRGWKVFDGATDLDVEGMLGAVRRAIADSMKVGARSEARREEVVETREARVAPAATNGVHGGHGGSLAQRIVGMTGLEARCPWAAQVELAVDGAGGLHLLVMADDEAVQALTVAAQWAEEHAAVLALTLPRGVRIDAGRGIGRHVFTVEAKRVRRLLDAPEIKAHLLAPVVVEGKSALVCADLN
ncbi:MAG: hypothetical protein VYC34_08975, partial [Planctomycetota bacterium]|nr:hypothetical protein [Planctomycetota bacterium]